MPIIIAELDIASNGTCFFYTSNLCFAKHNFHSCPRKEVDLKKIRSMGDWDNVLFVGSLRVADGYSC